jgi:hypothetical protein
MKKAKLNAWLFRIMRAAHAWLESGTLIKVVQ